MLGGVAFPSLERPSALKPFFSHKPTEEEEEEERLSSDAG